MAIELNPLMSALINISSILFIVVKMVLVNSGSYVLNRYSGNPRSIGFAVLALIVYAIVFIYHTLAVVIVN
jgi:hypothetical protein